MPHFRKKPVVIEARRMPWAGDHYHEAGYVAALHELADWCGGSVSLAGGRDTYSGHMVREIRIATLEGTMTADPGDWVIKGVQGEFYPCKPDIFDATYEQVPLSEVAADEPAR